MALKSLILKLKPEMSEADARKLAKQMETRFKQIAKNYGSEMQKQNKKVTKNLGNEFGTVLSGIKKKYLAVIAATAGIVQAITKNPYEEATRKLDEYLARIDNLATRAGQWNVDPAKFAIASEVAQVAGVDQSMWDNLLLRVADKIQAARTGEDTYLRDFVNTKDIVDATYQLVQTWKQLDPQARVASMAKVVGNRQANAFAELVDTDWEALAQQLMRGRSLSALRESIQRGGDLERQQAINRSQLRIDEIYRLGRELNPSQIEWQNRVEQAEQRESLDDIRDFQRIAKSRLSTINAMANTLDDIADTINDIYGALADEWGINGKEGKIRAAERNAAAKDAMPRLIEDVSGIPFRHFDVKNNNLLGGV